MFPFTRVFIDSFRSKAQRDADQYRQGQVAKALLRSVRHRRERRPAKPRLQPHPPLIHR
jgi:hypothetical protein